MGGQKKCCNGYSSKISMKGKQDSIYSFKASNDSTKMVNFTNETLTRSFCNHVGKNDQITFVIKIKYFEIFLEVSFFECFCMNYFD